VVPVFDEAVRVGEYVGALLAFARARPGGVELLFVDDGSSDDTVARLEAAGARVLRRPHAGKGAAVAAGMEALLDGGAAAAPQLLAFCDLDLSTPLDQLELVLQQASRTGGLAIASRDLAGSRLDRPEGHVRELLGRLYNRLLQAAVVPGVVDTQCGAKAAPAGVWRQVLGRCRQQGFAWDAEVVGVALALGIEVQEVAITWRHDDRSKVHVARDGLRMVAAVPQLVASVRHARQARPAPSAAAADGPARAGEHGVFDDANAAALADADRDHWWFRSKAALVATALRRTAGDGSGGSGWLVDVGGGAGGVTALLGWRPDRVVVAEGNAALVGAARARHGFAAARAEVDGVPLATGSVDVVCLLDVIEHLVDPVGALREAARVLGPDGRLVVNVPAHEWLWSEADVQLGHVRRYRRAALVAQLAEAGFEPVLAGHVFSWLVPPVWWRRRARSSGEAELGLDVASPAVDRAAMVLTALERATVGRVPLPFGTSILCVARRSGT
jgi:SAM-dependent methyltransferase